MHSISTLASNFQIPRAAQPNPQLASFRKIALASNFQPPLTTLPLNGKNSPRQHPKPSNYFRSQILFFIGGRNCPIFTPCRANYSPHPHPKTTAYLASNFQIAIAAASQFRSAKNAFSSPSSPRLASPLLKNPRLLVLENPRRRKTSPIHRHIHPRWQRLHKRQRTPQIEQSI